MTICEDNGAERQEERKMKLKDIIQCAYGTDFIRIHEKPTFKIIYAGLVKDIPESILDRVVGRVNASLNQDSLTFHYIPTLVVLLEEVDD